MNRLQISIISFIIAIILIISSSFYLYIAENDYIILIVFIILLTGCYMLGFSMYNLSLLKKDDLDKKEKKKNEYK